MLLSNNLQQALSNIYSMSGRVVLDIQTGVEGEWFSVYLIQHGRECCI